MEGQTIERVKDLGFKMQWSPFKGGIEHLFSGPWYLMAMDPDGDGYWTIEPERERDEKGKFHKPPGAFLGEEKPEEIAQALVDAGIPEVRLFRLEEKKRVCAEG